MCEQCGEQGNSNKNRLMEISSRPPPEPTPTHPQVLPTLSGSQRCHLPVPGCSDEAIIASAPVAVSSVDSTHTTVRALLHAGEGQFVDPPAQPR